MTVTGPYVQSFGTAAGCALASCALASCADIADASTAKAGNSIVLWSIVLCVFISICYELLFLLFCSRNLMRATNPSDMAE
jgi:hypothetical protein